MHVRFDPSPSGPGRPVPRRLWLARGRVAVAALALGAALSVPAASGALAQEVGARSGRTEEPAPPPLVLAPPEPVTAQPDEPTGAGGAPAPGQPGVPLAAMAFLAVGGAAAASRVGGASSGAPAGSTTGARGVPPPFGLPPPPGPPCLPRPLPLEAVGVVLDHVGQGLGRVEKEVTRVDDALGQIQKVRSQWIEVGGRVYQYSADKSLIDFGKSIDTTLKTGHWWETRMTSLAKIVPDSPKVKVPKPPTWVSDPQNGDYLADARDKLRRTPEPPPLKEPRVQHGLWIESFPDQAAAARLKRDGVLDRVDRAQGYVENAQFAVGILSDINKKDWGHAATSVLDKIAERGITVKGTHYSLTADGVAVMGLLKTKDYEGAAKAALTTAATTAVMTGLKMVPIVGQVLAVSEGIQKVGRAVTGVMRNIPGLSGWADKADKVLAKIDLGAYVKKGVGMVVGQAVDTVTRAFKKPNAENLLALATFAFPAAGIAKTLVKVIPGAAEKAAKVVAQAAKAVADAAAAAARAVADAAARAAKAVVNTVNKAVSWVKKTFKW
jgi:hypothetical protein